MRFKLIVAGLVGAAMMAGLVAVGAQAGQAQAPTLEQMRKAVADLRGGRIPRPPSYDAMTADQQAFVKSVLSGPRPDISGSLGVMIASPVFADLAQKTIVYSRFAGREGYQSFRRSSPSWRSSWVREHGAPTTPGTSIAARPSAPECPKPSSWVCVMGDGQHR